MSRPELEHGVPIAGAGRGYVVRAPGVLAVVWATNERAAELVSRCRQPDEVSPEAVAEGIVSWLDTLGPVPGRDVHAVCAAVRSEGGALVVARGDVTVVAASPGAAPQVVVAGAGLEPVHLVAEPAMLTVALSGTVPEPVDDLVSFESGVLVGEGFLATIGTPQFASAPPEAATAAPSSAAPAPTPPASVPAPDPAPVPAPAPTVEPEPVAAPAPAPSAPAVEPAEVRSLAGAAPAPREPLPVRTASSAPPAAEPEPEPADVVVGVHCARGHFNDPRAQYCGHCGIAMLQASLILVPGTRPSLGVLVFENGESVPLKSSLVVGRNPARHDDVSAGSAVGFTPGGDVATLSSLHAELRLDGWDVVVVDLDSTNGTYTYTESEGIWRRVPPRTPVALVPGQHVAFGQRTAFFESQSRTGF